MPHSNNEFLYFRGRVGLHHILQLLGIKAGDEVVVQAFTCVAVAEAVLAAGATPVWADVGGNSVNLSHEDFLRKITPRTKAVIVQHTFGVPADLDAILPLAMQHRIAVIEDCCHVFGSTHRDRPLGTLGTAAFWSYEWGKPVIAGLGGEVRFNAPALHAPARESYARDFRPPPARRSFVNTIQYAMHSLLYGPRRFWMVRRGYRMFSRAGIAVPSFNPVAPDVPISPEFGWKMCGFTRRRLDRARSKASAFSATRRQQAEHYAAGIHGVAARLAVVPAGAVAMYSRFPLFVGNKEELLAAAYAANVELAGFFNTVIHPLAGKELAHVSYTPGSCPLAEAAAASLVSLPLGPKVTRGFQDDAIALINRHACA